METHESETLFQKLLREGNLSNIFYEDEYTVAFLDNFPNSKGHSLVIPKKGVVNIFDTDEETLFHVMRTVRKVSPIIKEAVGASGINIHTNNGAAAGQVVFHMHVHIIPRFPDDGLVHWPGHAPNEAESLQLADKLRSLIGAQ